MSSHWPTGLWDLTLHPMTSLSFLFFPFPDSAPTHWHPCFLNKPRVFPLQGFASCCSSAWNILPLDICVAHSLTSFRVLFRMNPSQSKLLELQYISLSSLSFLLQFSLLPLSPLNVILHLWSPGGQAFVYFVSYSFPSTGTMLCIYWHSVNICGMN